MKESEIDRLGMFQIAERKETYNENGLEVQVTAHSLDDLDGGTLALFLTEDDLAKYEDAGHSLAAGSHIEVALLWPEGA